uniref:Uncharacterized protein n=1 Tax=Ixodes ricinus TaxID=34613 RepID=A0A6B0U1W8_IXORI
MLPPDCSLGCSLTLFFALRSKDCQKVPSFLRSSVGSPDRACIAGPEGWSRCARRPVVVLQFSWSHLVCMP